MEWSLSTVGMDAEEIGKIYGEKKKYLAYMCVVYMPLARYLGDI